MEKIIRLIDPHAYDHHSLTDWDFEGTTGRSLASDYYISSPTSLKYNPPSGVVDYAVLCKYAGTTALSQGQMVTWFRRTSGQSLALMFRNQCAVGAADHVNTYHLSFFIDRASLYRRVSSSDTWIADLLFTNPNLTWNKFRVTWWNGETGAGTPALVVTLEWLVGANWVQIGSPIYDTTNMWNGNPVNRCGIRFIVNYTGSAWCDDTEIWSP